MSRDGRTYGPGPYATAVTRAGALAGNWRMPAIPQTPWMATVALELDASVTFLVGENGTGKSTALEAIAVAAGFDVHGGELVGDMRARPELTRVSGDWALELTARRPRRGFFLRAEAFFNFAGAIDADSAEVYGGVPLNDQSHGESFVTLATNRFGGEGLYLLDEPEAALSVTSCLAFLDVMQSACADGAQFVIATHSPVLLAFPGARILEFADGEATAVEYDDTALVRLYRSFLESPGAFLRHLG